MSDKKSFGLKDLRSKISDSLRHLQPYSLLIFIAFVAVLYGFVLYRINSLSNTQPSSLEVSSQVKAAGLPRIDQSVINQLQSLQDNSVSVKSLFDQARSNPFQ